MANKKPRNFDIAVSFPADMEYYYQPPTGSEQKVSQSLLEDKLAENGFIKDGGTVAKSTGQSISFAAGDLVSALVLTPSTNMTIDVGTTGGGTDIIDGESLTSGTPTVFVINHYFSGSGALHFTLSTGTVTVHVKKL
jgi:hypothetical protein